MRTSGPIQSYPGVWCLRDNLDLIVVRENTQGFLADRNLYKGYGEFMPDENTVLSLRVLTRRSCERIAKFAFDYATKLSRKKITAVHKANVLRTGDGFFLDICKEVAKKYPPSSSGTTMSMRLPTISSAAPKNTMCSSPPTCTGTSFPMRPPRWSAPLCRRAILGRGVPSSDPSMRLCSISRGKALSIHLDDPFGGHDG